MCPLQMEAAQGREAGQVAHSASAIALREDSAQCFQRAVR